MHYRYTYLERKKAMELTTTDLETVLMSDPLLNFCGVMSYDTLPKMLSSYPCGLVINTDPSHKKGEHWVSAYFDNEMNCQYFCSFAMEPFGKIYDFVKKNSFKTHYNVRPLQSLFSPNCGFYAIYHLLLASRGFKLLDIVKTFDENRPLENDKLVENFVYSYVEKCRKN